MAAVLAKMMIINRHSGKIKPLIIITIRSCDVKWLDGAINTGKSGGESLHLLHILPIFLLLQGLLTQVPYTLLLLAAHYLRLKVCRHVYVFMKACSLEACSNFISM